MTTPQTPEALAEMVAAHFAANPKETLIIPDLVESLYRDADGENVSALKLMADSPKDYRYGKDHPTDATPDMILGTVIHFLVLQPQRPESECFVVSPYPDFRKKEAQEWRDSQTMPILTKDTLESARETARAITEHPRIAWILERDKDGKLIRAQTEVSAFRLHERTGMLLKGRADIVFTDEENRTVLADLKKAQSVKPSMFAKAIGDRLYNVSSAFYCDLFGASSHYLIPAKVGPPADADIFRLSDSSMERGRKTYEALLDRVAKCARENRYPGVSEDSEVIREIEEPTWSQRQQEELTTQ